MYYLPVGVSLLAQITETGLLLAAHVYEITIHGIWVMGMGMNLIWVCNGMLTSMFV